MSLASVLAFSASSVQADFVDNVQKTASETWDGVKKDAAKAWDGTKENADKVADDGKEAYKDAKDTSLDQIEKDAKKQGLKPAKSSDPLNQNPGN